jgi:glutamate synthase domain-containing protein 2
MIQSIRTKVMWAAIVMTAVLAALGAFVDTWWWIGAAVLVPVAVLGVYDYVQTSHTVTRNFPVVGHLRYLLEDLGPELHQYIVESDVDGRPFNRDARTLVYERARSVADEKPFGTEQDVYAEGYTYLTHSIQPSPIARDPVATMRISVGGSQCAQPYSLSVLNVSAMSFGALSGRAVQAMSEGARMGGFAQDTGEGGISRFHRAGGADLIWEIGTGYFGCRTPEGGFDPEAFQSSARDPQVKMIEVKLSQGAKPGHGGVLPGSKVTREIARARGVPQGQTCYSPPAHSAFSTPVEMMLFIDRLRTLSGGKPTGFKLCVGKPHEVMAVVRAMLVTEIVPDFIVVDGAEGGTGAAPQELSNSMGYPLLEGLSLVDNALMGAGLRNAIRLGASGKLVNAAAIATALALGADWCNTARAFMFSVGCIQAQRCHDNTCPTGVTTQDPGLQRALVVSAKAPQVRNFHANTVRALAGFVAAMGLQHTSELAPHHIMRRVGATQVAGLEAVYPRVAPGSLLRGDAAPALQDAWNISSADSFEARSRPHDAS